MLATVNPVGAAAQKTVGSTTLLSTGSVRKDHATSWSAGTGRPAPGRGCAVAACVSTLALADWLVGTEQPNRESKIRPAIPTRLVFIIPSRSSTPCLPPPADAWPGVEPGAEHPEGAVVRGQGAPGEAEWQTHRHSACVRGIRLQVWVR